MFKRKSQCIRYFLEFTTKFLIEIMKKSIVIDKVGNGFSRDDSLSCWNRREYVRVGLVHSKIYI